MKKSNVGDNKETSAGTVAGVVPFHSLLQTSIPNDFVIQQRGVGETICYNHPVTSSDDD